MQVYAGGKLVRADVGNTILGTLIIMLISMSMSISISILTTMPSYAGIRWRRAGQGRV